jgi:MFS transporter, MHS family, proline/betaine transporter
MSLTIGLMALGIGLVGFAPTYSQIGVGGALIVLLGRLLQGFSAGGEMGNATAFLVEYVPRHQRGFYSSLIQSSIGLAVLAGAGVGTLITGSLSPESLESWGWRVPFLIGLLIGPIGYYIRQHVDETPDFAAEKKASSPLSEVLRLYPRGAIAGFLMVILWTVCTYVLLYYMPTYVVKTLKMAQSQGFIGSVFAGFIILVVSPAIGALSDRIGRRVFLAGGALAIGVLAWPMFSYIDTNRSLASLLVFEGVFGLLICCYTGPILVTFASLFPTRVRSTGLSLSYNLAVTVFGGFASLIITLLISKTGSNLAPAYYVIAAAVLSLIGTLIYREHGAGA